MGVKQTREVNNAKRPGKRTQKTSEKPILAAKRKEMEAKVVESKGRGAAGIRKKGKKSILSAVYVNETPDTKAPAAEEKTLQIAMEETQGTKESSKFAEPDGRCTEGVKKKGRTGQDTGTSGVKWGELFAKLERPNRRSVTKKEKKGTGSTGVVKEVPKIKDTSEEVSQVLKEETLMEVMAPETSSISIEAESQTIETRRPQPEPPTGWEMPSAEFIRSESFWGWMTSL